LTVEPASTLTGPADPLSFSVIWVVLLAVAFAASYVPARRAAAIDPMMAMRSD
jgi:ABC-type lipoprotein release transport system permease subunit